jgi:glycosyltransferase involved in cell wall biosynthesis
MKIVIITSGHPPFDERIFYKFGISLKKYDHNVSIICSTEDIDTEAEGIQIRGFADESLSKNEKINRFFEEIARFNPSLIICCEPLLILAAHRYRKRSSRETKIIYDITEYYPHQNMLNRYSGIIRNLQYLRLTLFNAYVSNLADYLFIGEKGKAKLYNIIAPTVKKAIIGYYPPRKYFEYSPPGYDGKHFTICYAGNISQPGGFRRFIDLVKEASRRFGDKIFIAKIIGSGQDGFRDLINELSDITNVKVILRDRVSYPEYSSEFKDVDLCVDLRDKNIIFNRSLPIKVFDFLACGKPFIFSNLDSFEGFEDVKQAGLLINPGDTEAALQRIYVYLNIPEKLRDDSLNAYRLFREKYNWESIEGKMIDIINSLFKKQ